LSYTGRGRPHGESLAAPASADRTERSAEWGPLQNDYPPEAADHIHVKSQGATSTQPDHTSASNNALASLPRDARSLAAADVMASPWIDYNASSNRVEVPGADHSHSVESSGSFSTLTNALGSGQGYGGPAEGFAPKGIGIAAHGRLLSEHSLSARCVAFDPT